MKEFYLLHDTQQQFDDIILSDIQKVRRIKQAANGRISVRKVFDVSSSLGFALYEQVVRNATATTWDGASSAPEA